MRVQFSANVSFEKGLYAVKIGSAAPVHIERCRFHWLGWLLLFFGRTQQVTVNGKKTYVYLKNGDSHLTPLFQRIRSGKGQDLESLVAKPIQISPSIHRLLEAFYSSLSWSARKQHQQVSYTYNLHELAPLFRLSEDASVKDLESTVLNTCYPINEHATRLFGDGYHAFIMEQMPSTDSLVQVQEIEYLVLRKKNGAISHILPLEKSVEGLSDQDILFYQCPDVVTGKPYMIKMGVTVDGAYAVSAEYQARRALGDRKGDRNELLHIKKQLLFQPGGRAAYIAPYYPQGTLKNIQSPSLPSLKLGLQSLLEGVSFIHSKDKFHGDVSLSNVLLSEDQWILIDFESLGRFPSKDKKHWRHSPPYVGMEDKERLKTLSQDMAWNQKLDVAAIGLLVVYLYAPAYNTQYPSLDAIIERLDEIENLPKELHPLLKKMLEPDYTTRISIQEALTELQNISS